MVRAVVFSMKDGGQWLIEKPFMSHEPVTPLVTSSWSSVAHQKVLILDHWLMVHEVETTWSSDPLEEMKFARASDPMGAFVGHRSEAEFTTAELRIL
jgi:hypothetical protein